MQAYKVHLDTHNSKDKTWNWQQLIKFGTEAEDTVMDFYYWHLLDYYTFSNDKIQSLLRYMNTIGPCSGLSN